MSIRPVLRSIFRFTGSTDMTRAAKKEKGVSNGHSTHLSQTVRVATVSLSGVLACADDSACQGKTLVKQGEAQGFAALAGPVLVTDAGTIPMTTDRCDRLADLLRGQAVEADAGRTAPTVRTFAAGKLTMLRRGMTEAGGLTDEEHALFASARIKSPARAASFAAAVRRRGEHEDLD